MLDTMHKKQDFINHRDVYSRLIAGDTVHALKHMAELDAILALPELQNMVGKNVMIFRGVVAAGFEFGFGDIFLSLGFDLTDVLGISGQRFAVGFVARVLGLDIFFRGLVRMIRHALGHGAGTECQAKCECD